MQNNYVMLFVGKNCANRCMYVTKYDMRVSPVKYIGVQSYVYLVKHCRSGNIIDNDVLG